MYLTKYLHTTYIKTELTNLVITVGQLDFTNY